MSNIAVGSPQWHKAVQLGQMIYTRYGNRWGEALHQMVDMAHDQNDHEASAVIVEAGKLIRTWLANGTLKPKET